MSLRSSKPSIMMEFKAAAEKTPTLDEVKQQFNLADDEIDDTFGVIPLDHPTGKTFVTVVTEEAGERIEKQHMPGFIRNWSNPKMEPFSP